MVTSVPSPNNQSIATSSATTGTPSGLLNKSTTEDISPEARKVLNELSPEVLAQTLSEKLTISATDWHRLSSNRNIRAREQAAAALVYVLKGNSTEAIPRLQQAIGWLDKTLKAPPCPTHGEKKR